MAAYLNREETRYKQPLEEWLLDDDGMEGTANCMDGTANQPRENSGTNKLSKNSSNQFSGRQESRSGMQRLSRLLCFNCGQYGHIEHHCPGALSDTQNPNEEKAVVKKLLPDFNHESPDQSLRSNNKTSGGGWLDMLPFGIWCPNPPN
jgi:hypothetical protein